MSLIQRTEYSSPVPVMRTTRIRNAGIFVSLLAGFLVTTSCEAAQSILEMNQNHLPHVSSATKATTPVSTSASAPASQPKMMSASPATTHTQSF